ncbi:MAG: c-type cytochrome [Bryobacteraceae bacterium]
MQTRLLVVSILMLAALGSFPAKAQVDQSKKGSSGSQNLVERGKYIVEGVAMCELCHTQRDEHGDPDRANWLMGGPAQLRPAYTEPNWAQREPRIAGTPPGTDAEFIKLLTTGISRTGRPPNPPMPPFRMSREDAQAVLAYLKTLRR